ncbi:MAG: phosphoribosylformylglycinamidine cyclo-ligase [Thermoplasmata archaeon]|nr:phosphoribosylformylglycinamidine cyclo-ligase [Thermoplasmata archaeon]
MKEEFTYKEAGVDIKEEGRSITSILKHISFRRSGLGGAYYLSGHFSGLIEFGEYLLALTTDGVGSKILLAEALHKYDTIGIDCIAMNVNDLISVGAEPIAFVDYLAVERHDPEVAEEIGKGLNEGARQANITIVGGETATLPDIVKGFDLSGSALGYVKKENLITGEKVREGDELYFLPSSGVHSNGYTLVRKVLNTFNIELKLSVGEILDDRKDLNTLLGERLSVDEYERVSSLNKEWVGEVYLTPTKIYVKEVLNIIREHNVHGVAHITGGGVTNLLRLKKGVNFILESPPPPPGEFLFLKALGNISWKEMYKTFNMGIGMVLVTPPGELEDVRGVKRLGRVERGDGRVVIPTLNIEYSEYL